MFCSADLLRRAFSLPPPGTCLLTAAASAAAPVVEEPDPQDLDRMRQNFILYLLHKPQLSVCALALVSTLTELLLSLDLTDSLFSLWPLTCMCRAVLNSAC